MDGGERMTDTATRQPDADAILHLLQITRKLAGPYELTSVLEQVIDAGRQLVRADRGSVFLHDRETNELYSISATGVTGIRFPMSKGIAGYCARTRTLVNVADCYADPRFNREIDMQTGYRTHCLIAVPLIGLDGDLVGVLQLLNSADGCFSATDEKIAEILAGQAGAAIQRARLLEERLIKLKLERDLAVARQIQQHALPRKLPACPGYELAAFSDPADATGGDIYDVVRLGPGGKPAGGDEEGVAPLVLFLADASGHGIGPALSVTQLRGMLRLGLRLSTDLDALLLDMNEQLHEDLPKGRFITAFLGTLDPVAHSVRYQSAGQGPVLHYRAAADVVDCYDATTPPLGIVELDPHLTNAEELAMEPGDLLVLASDGIYERINGRGELLGRQRVADVVRKHHELPASGILEALLADVNEFAGDTPHADDMTAVILKRLVER
jgi:sigma-B regulation protein RsbU (phosphoserine phosphatase)